MKIDVEGTELRVLRGAARTLRRQPAPTWLVEITRGELHPGGTNPDFNAVFQLFYQAGYAATSVDAFDQPISLRGDGPELPVSAGSNYVFRRSGAADAQQ